MEKKKDKSMYFIIGSLALLFLAVIITTLINKNKTEGSADIRAKASVDTGVKYEAIVGSLEADGTIKVENVTPSGNPSKNFGSWVVTPTGTVNLTGISIGTKVLLTVDAESFNIKTHTMQAKTITKK